MNAEMPEDLLVGFFIGKLLRDIERVFRFHEICLELKSNVDLESLIPTLSKLCPEQTASEAIDDLRKLQRYVEHIPTTENSEARKIAERYSLWLRATFPEAFEKLCQHPLKKLRQLCEHCRTAPATVHITSTSGKGIERHEYCDPCYRLQMESLEANT